MHDSASSPAPIDDGAPVPMGSGAHITLPLDGITDALVVLDRAWRYVHVNGKAAGLFGRAPETLIGRHIWTEFPEGVGQPFQLAYERAMTTRVELRFEDHYAPWDRWFENRVFPVDAGILVLFTETTEARRAQRLLEHSEHRFRALTAMTAATVWWTDAEGAVFEPIPRWQAFTGQSDAEAHGWGWLDGVHPDDRAATAAAWQQALATRTPYVVEHRVRRHDGAWRTMVARSVPLTDAAGAVQEWVGTHVDVTDEREAADALRASEARFRSLSASSPVGIFEADNQAQLTYANPRALQIWEMAEADVRGSGWTARVHPDDLPALLETWAVALRSGQGYEREYRLRMEGGRTCWVHGRSAPLRDGAGAVVGVVGTVEDVTVRRELEMRLRQAQKMEAVGKLAGGIAHDFNNLLTVIQGNLELAAGDLTPEHPVHADLAEVMTAAGRAGALVRQLLAFSRQQVLATRAMDLNDAVRATVRLLPRVIGEEIALTVSLADAPLTVVADAGQLEQVLLNLSINARDAMLGTPSGPRGPGGALAVETAPEVLTAGDVGRWNGAAPGVYARLTVRDTGPGMDAETAGRAFEPFFTTKPLGEGTGLGLATVYGIVQQSGGVIRLDTARGVGTAVQILLPLTGVAGAGTDGAGTDGAPMWVARDDAASASGAGRTVLLAEDEAAVRAAVRRLLEQRGYAVIEARHGVEALELWRARRDDVGAIVTDLRMPQLGGPAFVAMVHVDAPSLPVVYMSGYAERGELTTLRAHEALVEKPLTGEQLWRALAQVLAARG